MGCRNDETQNVTITTGPILVDADGNVTIAANTPGTLHGYLYHL
jgi:isoaspartyl peptidase/L-asparaginase-like protein (Ntn-hydrolase superfamily)